MRFALAAIGLLAGCHAGSSTSAAIHAKPVEIAESDFRGTFNGATLYATVDAHDGIASGTCFYEDDGTDVPLRGAIDEHGVMMLQQVGDKGPVSSVTLTADATGAWTGTWKSADQSRSGTARLEPIARKPGDPVFVAARTIRQTRSDTRVPVVLGLADRAFEKKLDDALLAKASVRAPAGSWRVTTDYSVPLNERGYVSFEIISRYADHASDKSGGADGLTAAVDRQAIASTAADLIDVVKAKRLLVDMAERGYARCSTSLTDEHALDTIGAGVLTKTGVAIEHDTCDDHVHSPAWDELSFATLGSALRAGTAFEPFWNGYAVITRSDPRTTP